MSGEQPLANVDVSYDGKLLMTWNVALVDGGCEVWCAVHASPERYIGQSWDGWNVNQILPMDCQFVTAGPTYNKAFLVGFPNSLSGGAYAQVVWTANGPALIMQIGGPIAYDPPQTQGTPYAGLQVVQNLSEEIIGAPVLICPGGDVTSPAAYPGWSLTNVQYGPNQQWSGNVAPGGRFQPGAVGFSNGFKYFSMFGGLFLNPNYTFRDPVAGLTGYEDRSGEGGGQSSGPTLDFVTAAAQNQGDSVFLIIITDGTDAPVVTSTVGPSGPTDPYPFQFIESAPYGAGAIYLYASVERKTADPSWSALNISVIVADSTVTKWDAINVESSSGPIDTAPTFVVATGTGTTITSGTVTVTNDLLNSRNGATQVVLLVAHGANISGGPINSGASGGYFIDISGMHQLPPFPGPFGIGVDAYMLTATEAGTYTAVAMLDSSAAWSTALTTIPLGAQLTRPEMFQTISTQISVDAGIAVWNGSQFGLMYSYFDGIGSQLYWFTTPDPYDWPTGEYPFFTPTSAFEGTGIITATMSGGVVTALTYTPPLTGGPASAMFQLVFNAPGLTWTTPATGFVTTDGSGDVISATLTAGGTGYNATPNVFINQSVGAPTGFDPLVVGSVEGLCHVHDGILVGLLGDVDKPSFFHACRSYDGGQTWTADDATIPRLPTSAIITATILSGGVDTLTLVDPSYGYPPSTTLSLGFLGGGGSGADGTATTDQFGRIASIAKTASGSLYTSDPAVWLPTQNLSQVPAILASRGAVYLMWLDADFNPRFIASTDCGITWQ